MVLYACDLIADWDGLIRRYPFFQSKEEDRLALFGPPPARGSRPASSPSVLEFERRSAPVPHR
jgi:hypothetical protein